MTAQPQSPLKDPHYDLISIVEASLEMVWRLETYIVDADANGDSELADWFRRIQDNDRKAGEQGKQLLAQRLNTQA